MVNNKNRDHVQHISHACLISLHEHYLIGCKEKITVVAVIWRELNHFFTYIFLGFYLR